MFKKITAGVSAILLSATLVSCGSEGVSETESIQTTSNPTSTTDTSLPISQQIANTGITAYEMSDDDWGWIALDLCSYSGYPGYFDTVDEAMLDLNMDFIWESEEDRAIVAKILFANECPGEIFQSRGDNEGEDK